MLKLPNSFYAIERDGLHRVQITDEFVGPQADILLAMAKFVPRIVQGIVKDLIIGVNQTGFMLAKRIDFLAIHTFYRPMVDTKEKPVMVPVWVPPGSEIKCMWYPPQLMGLYFIQRWDCKDGQSAVGLEPLSYLVARHDETRRTFLLPLPNLYEDARVCLGSNKLSPRTKSAIEVLDKGIEILQTSTWNTDLLRPVDRAVHALFRFDADGNQIQVEGNWTEWCVPINSGNYEFIAKV